MKPRKETKGKGRPKTKANIKAKTKARTRAKVNIKVNIKGKDNKGKGNYDHTMTYFSDPWKGKGKAKGEERNHPNIGKGKGTKGRAMWSDRDHAIWLAQQQGKSRGKGKEEEEQQQPPPQTEYHEVAPPTELDATAWQRGLRARGVRPGQEEGRHNFIVKDNRIRPYVWLNEQRGATGTYEGEGVKRTYRALQTTQFWREKASSPATPPTDPHEEPQPDDDHHPETLDDESDQVVGLGAGHTNLDPSSSSSGPKLYTGLIDPKYSFISSPRSSQPKKETEKRVEEARQKAVVCQWGLHEDGSRGLVVFPHGLLELVLVESAG